MRGVHLVTVTKLLIMTVCKSVRPHIRRTHAKMHTACYAVTSCKFPYTNDHQNNNILLQLSKHNKTTARRYINKITFSRQ